nr:hypothetical protein [Lysinibacillus timonensis]
MKFKKLFTIVAIVILSIVVLFNLFQKDVWDINEELLRQEVLSIEESVETLKLSDVTPFEWDVVYSFDPYTPKDTIYETVGYKWDNISETVSEGMNQLVFLKDGKVVCYLYGYPQNNGYGIYFNDQSNFAIASASMLRVEDHLTFQVNRNDSYIYLMGK